MSDPKPIKIKGGALKLVALVGGALVLVTAGAVGGALIVGSGIVGGHADAAEHAAEPAHAESHYYALEQGFTANLRDSSSFLQASVAVSTRGDVKVVDAVKANEPAMRSVVLQLLAEQDYATVSTPAGRSALLARLQKSLNEELTAKVGFGGIDKVYFTAFVLQ